jgi:hypothetical protein
MVRAGGGGGFTKARSKFARVQNPDMADSDLSDVDADDEEALRAKVERGGEDDDDVRPSHRPSRVHPARVGSTPQAGARPRASPHRHVGRGDRKRGRAGTTDGNTGGRPHATVVRRWRGLVGGGSCRAPQPKPYDRSSRGLWGRRALRWIRTMEARTDYCTRRVCTLQRCNRPAATSVLTKLASRVWGSDAREARGSRGGRR